MVDLADWIVLKLHNINPMADDENMIIRYSLELIIEDIIKILGIIIFSLYLGKTRNFVITLFIFGSLRYNVGGLHAKTNWGCMFGMMAVCVISSIVSVFYIPDIWLLAFFILAVLIIIKFAPKTINHDYYNPKLLFKKKMIGIGLIIIYFLFAFKNINIRTLIIAPLLLEVLSLIPNIKREEKIL